MAGMDIRGWLVQQSGKEPGVRHALESDEINIGRGSACQIQLLDPKMSRLHARIGFQSDQLYIEDLESAHGVFVNGQKVIKKALREGDRIQLGDTQFTVELSPDSIGTIMSPLGEKLHDQQICRFCESPIIEGEAYCGTCGAITRELPEPFNFIQQAYLQLRALHQSGRMDAGTFRSELEKMIVSDGSGGYWMVGVRSGRWHWFNGREWILREPPSQSLRQVSLQETPPVPPPPAPPSPEISPTDIEEGKQSGRVFLIGGGALVAFSILAIGAIAAYRLVNADTLPANAVVASPQAPISTLPLSTPTDIIEEVVELPITTATMEPTQAPTETVSLPFSVRPYEPGSDENLPRLVDFVSFVEAGSSPEHAIFEGNWDAKQPALFDMGWCAIDRPTLDQNLDVIELSLKVDDETITPEQMYVQDREDEGMVCRYFRMVVEFSEPGEHRLLWTTSYTEPVFDGWQTLEAGTYLNEYVYDIRDVFVVEDEFEQSSGKWDETVQQNFSQWTEGGSFHIQVHKENFTAWSIYHDLEVGDGLILTHARRMSDVGGYYGVVFHYRDVSNFYYFIVDDAGYFQLGKRLAGEWIELIDWTSSELVLMDDDNRLGIMVTGSEIVAFLNGQVVGTVADDSFPTGSAGLIAQSNIDVGEMHAAFDVFYLEYYK